MVKQMIRWWYRLEPPLYIVNNCILQAVSYFAIDKKCYIFQPKLIINYYIAFNIRFVKTQFALDSSV